MRSSFSGGGGQTLLMKLIMRRPGMTQVESGVRECYYKFLMNYATQGEGPDVRRG